MSGRYPNRGRRFSQQLSTEMYHELELRAKKRDIGVPELIRAVIVPEWAKKNNVDINGAGNSDLPDRDRGHA